MISNSKILTVSYGTFSCTLEGFDDSFGTMKAIAEYFRDLAADDRYFGAEPPTPDAEMLARIAEREIARRVEAHEEEGKIVLRAEEEAPAALLADAEQADPVETAAEIPVEAVEAPAGTPEVAAPVVDATPGDDTADLTARVVAEAATEAQSEADEVVAEIAEDTTQDVDKAEETSEENLEVDEAPEPAAVSADEQVAEDTVSEAADASEDTPADLPPNADVEVETAEEPAQEPVEDTAAEAAEEAVEDVAAETVEDPEDQAEDEAAAPQHDESEVSHPDPDSVAAKLRRIRSVVAQTGTTYVDDFSEDEHAQDFLSTTASELDEALAVDDAAEEAAAEAAPETDDDVDDVDSILAAMTAGDAASDEAEVPIADAAPETAAKQDEPTAAQDSAETAELEETDSLGDTLAQLMADAMPAGDAQSSEETVADALKDAANATAEAAPESAPEASEGDDEDDDAEVEIEIETEAGDDRPMSARVVKMKRADLEAAIRAGQLEESPSEDSGEETAENLFSEEDTISGADDDAGDVLSPEEEAELQRELAEVEAEFQPEAEEPIEAVADAGAEDVDMADDLSADDLSDEEVAARLSENLLPDEESAAEKGVDKLQPMDDSSDVSRIFEQADEQLEEPDSSKRRNAIQHLRAAVAATRAEKNAGVEISQDVDDTPYRTDLAEVVRPRRPRAAGSSRSERPGIERPAPLKLVAEQRIDTEQAPVRPRRVASMDTGPASPAADGSNFAEFAEEMGAGSLPELLEAAAAYMADVEGRPQFSRPMLMGKLKEVEGDAFSREDGLRSFGQLLRQGKLQKLKGGRFAVTDETEFRAPARNVG